MFGRILAVALVVTGCVGGIASCGGDDDVIDPADIDCSQETPKTYDQLTIIPKCTNCHASTRTNVDLEDKDTSPQSRHGATAGYDYDTEALAKAAKDLGASDVGGVGDHEMPPVDEPRHTDGGKGIPSATAAEKKDFIVWAKCAP